MQRDFDRFEKRAGKNLVKFKEAKYSNIDVVIPCNSIR